MSRIFDNSVQNLSRKLLDLVVHHLGGVSNLINGHLQKLIMLCPKAFVGAQGIAPLNNFWRCILETG